MTSNPSRNLARAACAFGVAGLLALATPLDKAEATPVNGDLLVAGTSANLIEQAQWGQAGTGTVVGASGTAAAGFAVEGAADRPSKLGLRQTRATRALRHELITA